MSELLVHTEHIGNLATANTYVACGNILVGTDMTEQFGHEGLAETHYLVVALATGREVRTALAAAHGQSGERVLECLLESKELKDALVYRCVVADTAFVRANGIVVLDAVAHIGLNVALVVNPSHAELDDAIGYAETLYQVCTLKLGVLVVFFFDCS